MILRHFGWSLAMTAVALVIGFVYGGWTGLALCAILGVLEVSLSFDNAVINAKVLERMSPFWQKIFLTVGIAVAVVGMRILFPLLIVGVTAHLGPVEAVRLAMEKGDPEEPGTYGYLLDQAHPQIAAFGGMFLLMIFLDFLFEDRDITWLSAIERPLARIGKLDQLSVIVAGVALIVVATTFAPDPFVVMVAGTLGVVTYLVVNGLGSVFEAAGARARGLAGIHGDATAVERSVSRHVTGVVGKAGLFLFLYLEVLDASFSFDGVTGAFAITSDPVIIALGLGVIGAVYVRSITVFLVREGTLKEYVYLEHGAHWAIGALAGILLVSIEHHVDEVITGLVGVAFIVTAWIGSVVRKRMEGAEPRPGSVRPTRPSPQPSATVRDVPAQGRLVDDDAVPLRGGPATAGDGSPGES